MDLRTPRVILSRPESLLELACRQRGGHDAVGEEGVRHKGHRGGWPDRLQRPVEGNGAAVSVFN